MSKIPTYLHCRNNIWYFHYRIPTCIRKRYTIKKQFIRRSLHTSDGREAILLSRNYMAMVMADEKTLLEMESSIARHDDLVAAGRRVHEEYEAVQKYGDHDAKMDFIVMLKSFELEALQYVSKVLSEENGQDKQNQLNDLKVYGKELAELISTNVSTLSKNKDDDNTESIRLEALIQGFIDHKKRKGDWKVKTLIGNSQMMFVLKDFLECCVGEKNPMIHLLTEAHSDLFEDKFHLYPSNCKKKYPDKSMEDIMQMIDNGDISYKVKITDRTFNQYANLLMACFKWASTKKGEKYLSLQNNVFIDLRRKVRGAKKERPFTNEQLQLFFGSEMFVRKEVELKYAWRYWLPIILLYHGTRLEEICQLQLKDIVSFNGVICFDIKQEYDDEGRLVTSTKDDGHADYRRVPVHPKLKDIGFMKYVEYQKSVSATKLFPTLKKKIKDGQYIPAGHDASKFFNEDGKNKKSYFTKVGIDKKQAGIKFYNLRHTVQSFFINCREGLEREKINILFGHSNENMGAKHYGTYDEETIYDIVKLIEYPDAKLPWDVDNEYGNISFPWEK